jgi:hypothetical protein
MESPIPQVAPLEQTRKSNTGLIIGIVVAVLLCCCCLIIVGVFLFMGPVINNVYSSVNQQLTAMPEIPSMPSGTSEPSNPSDSPTTPSDSPSIPSVPSNLVPQGGLGDDTLRTNTWGYVITAAALSGCIATDASKTTIDVLQPPDSAGVWKEKWTVTCDDSTNISFDVSFTPNPQGGTDIKVTTSK